MSTHPVQKADRAIAFEPESASYTENPYDVYASLRALDGLQFSESLNAWLLARFEDVHAAATHPKLVRSLEAFCSHEEVLARRKQANWHDMPNHARYVQVSLLESDGPEHMRLRRLVLRDFTAQAVEQHREMIHAYVQDLLDRMLQLEEIDFIGDFAVHVPGHIIGRVLGVPDEDCPMLRVWSENVVQFYNTGRTEADKQLAETATTEFLAYLQDLIAQRRKSPRTDLLSSLIAKQNAGGLDERELISTCMLILMAGHGSTIDVIGTGMLNLLRHPDQIQRLRGDPGIIESAVQEMFRYETPLPYFHRYASEDVSLFGRTYPMGTTFGLLYGSANRDPGQFPAPDEFNVDRTPNRHMSFARGPHLCLGNHLSRLDMDVIFTQILKRTAAIELLTDSPEFKTGLSIRGLKSLPLRLAAA